MLKKMLWVSLGAVACGPSTSAKPTGDEGARYARAVCDAVDECGCTQRFASRGSCLMEMEARFAAGLAIAQKLDLTCLDMLVAENEFDVCGPGEQVAPMFQSCTLMRGTKTEGDACLSRPLLVPPFLVSTCEEGLACIFGGCVPSSPGPPEDAAEGDVCDTRAALQCGTLYCGYDDQCHPLVEFGEACDHPRACVGGAIGETYCKGIGSASEGTCVGIETVGGACDALDPLPCSVLNWCDPELSECVDEGPFVCEALDHYRAWPER